MKYLFALFLTLAAFGSALAEPRDTLVTTVPFDFVVGNVTFPAGTYSISRISSDPEEGLLIRSSDGKALGFFHVITSEPVNSSDKTKLQFRHQGDKYFLTEVVGGLETYTLAPLSHHQKMADPNDTVNTNVGP